MSELAERILKAAKLAKPIFVAHEWTWGGIYPDEGDVPTVEEIADCIKRLYDIALRNGEGSASSGRLHVYVDENDGEISVDVQLAELRDAVPGWLPPDETD